MTFMMHQQNVIAVMTRESSKIVNCRF